MLRTILRLFVTLRDGRIMLIKNGGTLPTPFLDIRSTLNRAVRHELILIGLIENGAFRQRRADRELQCPAFAIDVA
jgi:hypothetical protein